MVTAERSTTPASNVSTSVAGGVDRVARAEWNALAAGRTFYVSHEWSCAFSGDPGGREAVVVARDENERLVGALACYATPSARPNPRYDLFELFGVPLGESDARREAWRPQLLGGAIAGYANALLAAPSRRPEIVAALVARFRSLAGEWESRVAAIPYLRHDDLSALLPFFEDGAVPLLLDAATRLRVRWRTFEEYVAAISARRRSVVQRDFASFDDLGADLTVSPLAGQERRLAPLLANVDRRHGLRETDEHAESFLRRYGSCGLDRMALVFRADLGDRPLAFALAYHFGDQLALRVVGLDYAASSSGAAYFQTLFYAPIRYAIEHEIREIDFGITAYRPKLLRGCDLVPLWGIAVPPAAAGADLEAAARRHNSAARERWTRNWSALAGSLDGPEWALPAP
jgi:uncharacterized protein